MKPRGRAKSWYKAVTEAGAWNYRHGFRVGACIRDGPLSTGAGPKTLNRMLGAEPGSGVGPCLWARIWNY